MEKTVCNWLQILKPFFLFITLYKTNFSFIMLFFFLVYLTESTDVVIGSVYRSKGLLIEAQNQKIRDFWTPARLKAAKSLDIILPKLPQGRSLASKNRSNRPPSGVPGSMPPIRSRLIRTINSNGHQVYTTGKVFFHAPDGDYMCSGAIVTSTTGDLVATAAHCVYDIDQHVWLTSNWVFIPAYSNGSRLYGTWPARNFIVLEAWTNYGDYNYDVAFVALSTLGGWHIQSYLGSQGVGFNCARSDYTYSIGYPDNVDDGNYQKSCVGYAQNSTDKESNYRGQKLACHMAGGASGGPWLQYVDESSGMGYVTAVNSFIISSLGSYIYGPYFDSNIQSLYDSAKTM